MNIFNIIYNYCALYYRLQFEIVLVTLTSLYLGPFWNRFLIPFWDVKKAVLNLTGSIPVSNCQVSNYSYIGQFQFNQFQIDRLRTVFKLTVSNLVPNWPNPNRLKLRFENILWPLNPNRHSGSPRDSPRDCSLNFSGA